MDEINVGDDELNQQIKEQYQSLPKVVQDAINSADIQKRLRDLAATQKLHVDQWQLLENNVMLTLLGFQPVQELGRNFEKDLSVTPEVATELATAVSEIVFKPIRSEMEHLLDHPSAEAAPATTIDTMRAETLAGAEKETVAATTPATQPEATTPSAPVIPATPPQEAPTEKAVRGAIAETYVSAPSHERKTIEGDPYREQLS